MSDSTKKAYVLLPVYEPFDSYYSAIFKPALEAAGYSVHRAGDLFAPRPIVPDIQKSILEADLLLCEMSSQDPNMFYELGLAHAVGKPAILAARKEDDIPFNLRHVRAIIYDYTEAGWEDKLRDSIKAAAHAVATSDEIWPPPLVAQQEDLGALRALTNEIDFNLREIDNFLARSYKVVDGQITAGGNAEVTFRYFTCLTSVFDSNDIQSVVQSIRDDIREDLLRVYDGFRDINDSADLLKRALLPWRAIAFIETVEEFNDILRSSAERLRRGQLLDPSAVDRSFTKASRMPEETLAVPFEYLSTSITVLPRKRSSTPSVKSWERSQDLTLRPTLFLGSGGTGHLILLCLKTIFLLRHGDLPQGMRIVVFDTSDGQLSISVGEREIALKRGIEFCCIGNVPVAELIQHIDSVPGIRTRLPQIASLSPSTDLRAGAAQSRPLGLLALLWHIDPVLRTLADSLWELSSRQHLGVVDGIRVDAASGIRVFQVGSLCGGTNSGQFLDLAYLTRSLLEQLGRLANLSEIIGLGVLPDVFRNVRGPNLVPNTIAALHELDHCMVKGGFKTTYRNGHVVDTPRPPFDIYYLLGAEADGGRVRRNFKDLCWMTAEWLYHMAVSPIGAQQESMFANAAEVLTHQTKDGHGTFFASFGLAELRFPAGTVAMWCGYQHARAVISQGLLSPPAEDEVQRAVESTLQAQELTPDALHQHLAVDDTGIPLAVELQPPARIRDADAHTVPQLAMNYVQAYRRQRVEGDFRIWVRENARRRQEHLLRDLSASIRTTMDDPGRGLLFAHAFARDIGAHLADLAAALTAHRQALQSERSDRETRLDNSLADLTHAPETNWLFRGQAVEKALDQYFKDAQEFLETQFELSVLDGAIAVVVAAQEHVGAWAHNLETLVTRLQAINDKLHRSQRDLLDELLAPARGSNLALVDSSYLERLYQEYAPTTSATLGALLEDKSHAPHRWIDRTRDTVEELIIRAARQPFEAIRGLSVEQVIQDRSDQMTARQWVQMLAQKARPAWNLNEVLLPEGAANLARIELLGVPDRERSIYAGDAARLVSTSDPHRITAFTMVAGAPLTALQNYQDYLQVYERVRSRRPLHVLPEFVVDDRDSKS